MHILKKYLHAEQDAFRECQTYNLQPTWHILNILVTMSETEPLNNSSVILS